MSTANGALKQLGLTELETSIYTTIKKNPDITARSLSNILNKPRESVHRSLQALKNKGFISPTDNFPRKFNTVPVASIYTKITQETNAAFNQLLSGSLEEINFSKSNLIRYIPNRETHHKIGEELFHGLKDEVLIIASGTGEFNPSFFETMVRINEAKKKHRIIVMTLDETNIQKLRIWKKNGIQIRYKKGKGLNLIIYDREIIQLAVRVKEGSKEKEGVLLKNSTLGNFLAKFYYFLWKRSKKVI